jgi:CRISPR-associated protein Cas1
VSEIDDSPITVSLDIIDSSIECARLGWMRFWNPIKEDGGPESTVGAVLGCNPSGSVAPEMGYLEEEYRSDSLGIEGKVVLKFPAGRPCPAVRERDGGGDRVHDYSMVRLGVRSLLMLEHRQSVSDGVLFDCLGGHRLVNIDETAKEVARRKVKEFMHIVEDDAHPPAPTDDTSLCNDCPYYLTCLPDEWMTLHGIENRYPRRVRPVVDPARPVYVTEQGARLSKDGGLMVIENRKGEELGRKRLIDISQLILYGNVSVSSSLMRILLSSNIPVCYLNRNGWFVGVATGLPGKNVRLRECQFRLSEERQLEIAKEMIRGKLINSKVLLRRHAGAVSQKQLEELRTLERQIDFSDSKQTLLGIEGSGAAAYFSQFSHMLGNMRRGIRVSMAGRSRRPPRDPVNSVLSYVYSLIIKDCIIALWQSGLDPFYGVFHRPKYGRPALALDMAEEFRPLVGDSVALWVFNNHILQENDFEMSDKGVFISQEGRRNLIKAYEGRLEVEFQHAVFGYKINYRQAFYIQARILAGVMLGEYDRYTPLTTR